MKHGRKPGAIRNLGPVSMRLLAEIGVRTIDDLRAIGSLEAFVRLRFIAAAPPSRNLLHAMEAALLDSDWRDLPEQRKRELDAALERVSAALGLASDRPLR
jgi:DNA transformation protein and related proteins